MQSVILSGVSPWAKVAGETQSKDPGGPSQRRT